MHEWALAEAIVSAASEIAERESLKEVTEIRVLVGELQQIDLDILQFALSEHKTAKFGNVKFSIEKAQAKLRCRVCQEQWTFDRETLDESTAEAIHFIPEVAHTYINCPKCGSPDFEIIAGRGVWLESIRGAK